MDENVIQNIICESRKKITITGVTDMVRYTDEEAVLITKLGRLTLRGSDIKIGGYNTQTGDTTITGHIYAFVYTDEFGKSESFFKKLIK